MQVKANNNVDAAQRVIVNQSKPRRATAASDTTSFDHVVALDAALQATPAVRPEVVCRAKDLINDVKYPPADAINGIATLLALKLDNGDGA